MNRSVRLQGVGSQGYTPSWSESYLDPAIAVYTTVLHLHLPFNQLIELQLCAPYVSLRIHYADSEGHKLYVERDTT
ncbi:hypothetical protein J6590_047263 [Homalodisca vitripennis]|nr:hypothetical protein J6590_047263 [Homalodisca vitripennis]